MVIEAFYVIRIPIFKLYNRLHSLFFKDPKICGDAWKEVKLDNEAVDPKIQYFIGYSWPTYQGHWHKGLQLKRYECKKPCKGETPCIR